VGLVGRGSRSDASAGNQKPSRFPVLPLAIEAAAALGNLDDANRLLERLQHQADTLDSRWARAAVLRARGHIMASQDPAAALAFLADAAAAYHELRLPLEQGRTLLARGSLARRNRQHRLARADITDALDVFDRHGAMILAAHARQELGKLGGQASHGSRLTTAQLATAQLAAGGLTNAQIARRLSVSVSVKTVETHLGNVFHKLGVHSRVQLANELSRGDPVAGNDPGTSLAPSGSTEPSRV
jgi:DNA-binding NarL/FixJ family response regulator